MLIRRLQISGVRNLVGVSLQPLSPINILYGNNGAGKTSVLEAIHLLSSARSFRSHKLKPLINHTSESCVSFAEINIAGAGFQPVGVERSRSNNKPSSIKVSGQPVRSAAMLAENLPLQVICADTFKLLEGSPSVRRQFLDWGVFHVEHRFHAVWKSAQRCLKQRNSLLRHGRMDDGQLAVWTAELVGLSEQLDQFRARYYSQLIPVFNRILQQLIALDGLTISYYRGWDKEQSLAEIYASHSEREKAQGHTLYGYHRADLRFKYCASSAADILSRGQQKLVVCALRVAQGYLLSQLVGRPCVFLIDDLPAELDFHHRKALCALLEALDCQVFVTCVDYKDMTDCWSDNADISMFHVEHGKVTAETTSIN